MNDRDDCALGNLIEMVAKMNQDDIRSVYEYAEFVRGARNTIRDRQVQFDKILRFRSA